MLVMTNTYHCISQGCITLCAIKRFFLKVGPKFFKSCPSCSTFLKSCFFTKIKMTATMKYNYYNETNGG